MEDYTQEKAFLKANKVGPLVRIPMWNDETDFHCILPFLSKYKAYLIEQKVLMEVSKAADSLGVQLVHHLKEVESLEAENKLLREALENVRNYISTKTLQGYEAMNILEQALKSNIKKESNG